MVTRSHLPVLVAAIGGEPPEPPPPPEPLALGGAVRGRVAAGITLTDPTDTPPAMSARIVTLDRDLLVDFAQDRDPWVLLDHEWEDPVNDAGYGTITVYADDPIVTDLDEGLLIEHYLHGQLAFTSLVESWTIEEVNGDGPARQVCKIEGRGYAATLEWALVYPSNGVGRTPPEIDRIFDWTSPAFPDDGWAPAKAISTATTLGPHWAMNPSDWPDPLGKVIWDPRGTVQTAPVGFVYFRKWFTLDDAQDILIYVSSDGPDYMWLDGRPIHENKTPGQGLTDIFVIRQEVDAGPHLLAVRVENRPWRWSGSNPAGLLVAGYELDEESSGIGEFIFRSDTSWKMVGYPAQAPGMTPGQVLRIILEEAHDRGAIPWITLGCTDDVDSAGQPWEETSNLATKVGTDALTFIYRELTAHYIDVWIEPGTGVLHAWRKGGRGQDRFDVDWEVAPIDEVRQGSVTLLRRQRA